MELHPRYLLDEHNNPIGVELDLATFERIERVLEDYALYHLMTESEAEQDNDTLSLEQAKSFYGTFVEV